MELYSPSRRDGISLSKESQLRSQYCSYISQLGTKLRLPHLAIVKAIIFCHRFYARLSFAKNDWHTVSTACILLAGKVEESPRLVKHVVNEAYGNEIQDHINQMVRLTINLHDMKERDEFCRDKGRVFKVTKQKLIIAAESLVLRTIGYDLNPQLPYKTLFAALRRLSEEKITGFRLPEVNYVSRCLVEELLRTSLCLQYKPQYIAAGSVAVAASILKLELPASEKWLEGLDVSPKELKEVIQRIQSCRIQPEREVTGSVSLCEVSCH